MSPKKLFDPFLIAGTAISIITSVILYLSGSDTAISVLIGLVGSVVTLQIDILARVERLRDEESEAKILYNRVRNAQSFTQSIFTLIDRVEDISQSKPNTLLIDHTRQQLDEVNENLRMVSAGRIKLDFWHSDLLIKAVEQAQNKIMAVSPVDIDDEWWKSSIGKKYLEAHRKAKKRGVSLTRIFLLKDLTQDIREIMAEQVKIGINICYAYQNDLPSELQEAFVLFDDDYLHRTISEKQGDQQNIFSVNPADISKYQRNFSRLLSLTIPYSEN